MACDHSNDEAASQQHDIEGEEITARVTVRIGKVCITVELNAFLYALMTRTTIGPDAHYQRLD